MYSPRTLIHLGVDDIQKSAAFYEALLGAPPLSRATGVAVFEMDAPALVLTLETWTRATRALARKHPGVRQFAMVVPRPEQVGTAAIALRRAGAQLRLLDRRIEAVDPDGNGWGVRFEPLATERSVIPAPEASGAA
ncbi:MAG TPA: VOC family protein [Polyangiaceae bacterium]|jgi:catechol-2,3-dioxygenase|nr:VOC family protein [Polyangiaceae bacterium]